MLLIPLTALLYPLSYAVASRTSRRPRTASEAHVTWRAWVWSASTMAWGLGSHVWHVSAQWGSYHLAVFTAVVFAAAAITLLGLKPRGGGPATRGERDVVLAGDLLFGVPGVFAAALCVVYATTCCTPHALPGLPWLVVMAVGAQQLALVVYLAGRKPWDHLYGALTARP